MEIWKDIAGFENIYQVSNIGKIKIVKTDKIRKIATDRGGYQVITLICKRIHPINKTYKVHRLVAQAFIPNPENLPTVNHKDGNKLNNNVNNLEWSSMLDNNKHAYANNLKTKNLGESNNFNKLSVEQVKDIIQNCNSLNKEKYIELYKVNRSTINRILRRKIWKHLKIENE